jgi:trans-aconitate methyltransferase
MQLMKKEPLIVVVSNTDRPTDLGGWITMEQTAATVANLIRYRLPQYPKVLDVGCGGGMLAGELPPSVHYLGIDASESTIEAAQSLWGDDDIRFEARDIREFDPVGNWDAVVFSEVLSYLAVHEAITEVRRYAEALSPEGIVAHQHEESPKEPRDLACVATRVSMDRRYSLATKGAVALLPDRREPRAPRPSRRRAPSMSQGLRRRLIRLWVEGSARPCDK